MTALPVDQSPILQQAVEITKGLNAGTQMIQNPVANQIASRSSQVTQAISRTTDPAALEVLGDLQRSISQLHTHTDRLVYGDNSATPIRGGFARNVGMSMAAIDLNDTLNGVRTEPGIDPCALIQNFLGRILGAGAALLRAIQAALRPILALVGDITNALLAALGKLSRLARQVLNLIANEIARFTNYLVQQLNFGLARFLSALNLIPRNVCGALALGAVATPALIAIQS